ncbi:MAG: hypothetical protein ACRDPJ_19845 [Nocardioidaceae bacterium]
MTTRRSTRTPLRRALPWVIGFGAFQLTLRAWGLLLARRFDTGDASSSELRRVRTLGSAIVKSESRALMHLQFELVFAGLDLDLTQAQPAPGGIDLELNCAFAGANIRVPADWRIAWDSRGPGGIDARRPGAASDAEDPASADLRVHLRALFGGAAVRS